MDASTLYGDVKEITIPAVLASMPKLAGCPADYPSIEGGMYRADGCARYRDGRVRAGRREVQPQEQVRGGPPVTLTP